MAIKRKTRMYEPWGYREENNYQGREIICENDLDSFFADTEYVKDDNKIYFYNKDGEKVGILNVEEFVKSDSIVEKTEYKDGILKIYFTNGDIITIDLTELLDENEFKDGLIVADHVVKVLVDANSERWLTVSPDGVKVSGIQAEIDRLDERIDDEIARATSEEARIEAKLDQEIADRIADVDEEEARATGEETRIEAKLDQEITRATQTEQELESKINTLNAEIDSEERRAEAAEQEIRTLLTKEINDRIADVDAEETRAKAAEQALQNAISAEEARAISAETALDAKIDQEIADREADVDAEEARAISAETDLQTAITAEETRATSTESDLQDAIDLKANAADVYTKGEIDGKESALQGGINANADAITDLQTAVDLKADKTEIPTDFYTKGEVDGKDAALQASIDANADAIALKADKTEIPTDFYTQEEVNVMMSQLLTRIKNLEEKESIIVADTAAEVAAAPANSDVVIASTEAIQALTAGTEYNTITIVGGNANNGDIKAKATDKLTMDGTTINGDKGASNGRVLISASTVDLKNITIESGSTAYNVFEGTQNTADSSFFTSSYTVSNLTVDNTELNHNVLNIYTPADDAVITIKDSYLNLDVDKSNLLRLANYTNATGVTVNFENVEWTYENAPASDWGWAGLVIYQPSSTDVALNGDTSKIATWAFNFKNCKYNGEVVDAVNYGEHNQVIYGYDINRTGSVSDISSIVTVNFE